MHGPHLVSSSWDCHVRVWDVSSDNITCLHDIHAHKDSVGA